MMTSLLKWENLKKVGNWKIKPQNSFPCLHLPCSLFILLPADPYCSGNLAMSPLFFQIIQWIPGSLEKQTLHRSLQSHAKFALFASLTFLKSQAHYDGAKLFFILQIFQVLFNFRNHAHVPLNSSLYSMKPSLLILPIYWDHVLFSENHFW